MIPIDSIVPMGVDVAPEMYCKSMPHAGGQITLTGFKKCDIA